VRRSIARFVYTQHLIGLYIMKGLLDPAGPSDVYLFNYWLKAESEVHSFLAGRQVATACRYNCMLLAIRGNYFHASTDCVSIALVADKIQRKPMILGVDFVMQNVDWTPVFSDNGIESSVVINVADRHPATGPGLTEDRSGLA
jgi:hypothetical protein